MNPIDDIEEVVREQRPVFTVVHPLDDVAEEKVDTASLGPMAMTQTVRVCLLALRGYLLLMFGLLGFRVLELARVVR